MRMKLVAASLLALGMATSAFAQSNPAPTGSSIDKSSPTGAGGGASSDAPAGATPMVVDPTATNSTMTTGSGMTNGAGMTNCKGSSAANSTGNGAVQTQGGNSNATTQDQACAQ